MVLPRTPSASPQRYRASQDAQHPRDPKRRLLHRPRRLRLAPPAPRLPTLEDCLPLLPLLALGRDVGEGACRPAQASASSPEEGPTTERGHSVQPVGQDDRGGRKRARLRWRKKIKGRKRHLLVDTQGLVLEVRVHSAKVMDRDGIKLLLDPSSADRLPRLSHLWVDAGYNGQDKGADWVQKMMGWTAEIVRHPPKLVPEEVMKKWVRELTKEGVQLDREKLQEQPKGHRAFLPKRWIVERTFSWLGQNRRMSKDYERLPESGEAVIYVAMSRLMARRLARS